MSALEAGTRTILNLPRQQQPAAIAALLAELPAPVVGEAWNSAFGPGSLFEAWTLTTVARSVYAANVEVLRPILDARPGWTALEVGAGNGALWSRLLRPDDVGTLVAYDPSADALAELGRSLPPGVTLDARVQGVESAGALPEADLAVCSLTLHHVAGRDAAERRSVGLDGPGKGEVLATFRRALAPRGGLLVLNEADVHCEIDLPARDPVLADRLIDSYVRRCARSLLADLATATDPDLAARWRHILRHWCLEQIRMAAVPVAERDVYELDVARWRQLLDSSGLVVERSRFTDAYGLFHQYVCRSR